MLRFHFSRGSTSHLEVTYAGKACARGLTGTNPVISHKLAQTLSYPINEQVLQPEKLLSIHLSTHPSILHPSIQKVLVWCLIYAWHWIWHWDRSGKPDRQSRLLPNRTVWTKTNNSLNNRASRVHSDRAEQVPGGLRQAPLNVSAAPAPENPAASPDH